MTREELIRNLTYVMKKHENDVLLTFDTNISLMCKDILDYLEQEPRWIPINEKLPEIQQEVLLCLRSGVDVGFRDAAESYYNIYINGHYVEPQDVLAWMPLPDIYKAESENKGMIFEIGKTYQHSTGDRMTIIGRLKTHIYGDCLIGERDTGELVPVGGTEANTVNWHEVKSPIVDKQKQVNDVLDKIRAEIERYNSSIDNAISEDELKIEGMKEAYADCLKIIDKYKAEDVLDKIIADIKEWYWQTDRQALAKDPCVVDVMIDLFIQTIDKYREESEN